jgi:hypothetical protein
MKIEIINCFLTAQLIISSNNLKIYFLLFCQLKSFAKNASSIFFKKNYLSLFFLFDDVFLFNFEFDVNDISLFELKICLLSFSFSKIQ